jgi:hypothetical protein
MPLPDPMYAARMLRKNPVFTAAAVLTLALDMGRQHNALALIDAASLDPSAALRED